MRVTRLEAARRTAVPWKNGGGRTWEIAAHPPDAGFEGFHWRISMARVERDGPFSKFPGIRRTLAVMEGAVRLCEADRAPVELRPDSAPWEFPGDVPVHAEVLAPVLDLNLMHDPAHCHASLARVDSGAAAVAAPLAFVVAATPVELAWQAGRAALRQYDALRLDAAAGLQLQWPAGTPVHLVRITPPR